MEAYLRHYTGKSCQLWGLFEKKENECEQDFYNRVIGTVKERMKTTAMKKHNSYIEFSEMFEAVAIENIATVGNTVKKEMDFRIKASSVADYENILEKYPCLKQFNITQKYQKSDMYGIEELDEIASIVYYIEISSLDLLKELQNKVNACLIIDFVNMSIEIYDGYRE
jgi:hypothetical protein